jgi:hypothetical protein
MAKAVGVEVNAAVKKAAAWGTAVALGANNGILILPHSLRKQRGSDVDDSLGIYWPNESDPTEIAVAGDLPMYLRYDSIDLLIALAMGATGGAPTQPDNVNDPNTYQQFFTLADDLDGLFATFCVDNNVNIDEFRTVKLAGFTLRGEVGRPLQVTFHCVGDDREDSSAVNPDFAAVTYFETKNRVKYSQGVFRMNNAGGAALAGGDEVYPSAFTLTYRRQVEGAYGIQGTFDIIDEPTNSGVPEVTLDLEFPRYTTKAHFTDWAANQAKKMDMVFSGAVIDVNYAREFKLEFPNLMYNEVDLPMDHGILRHPVRFNVLGTDAAPAGMNTTKPFRIDVTNRKNVDVLS